MGQRPEASILRVRSLRRSRHRLDQHGAALAAADAFGGDALLDAAALHGVDEMQHDAVAARAHGVAQPDGAAGRIDRDKLNVDGGAIGLGHPVGASGNRIVLHLVNAMKRRGVKQGIATECIGGGQGGAMLIEAVS